MRALTSAELGLFGFVTVKHYQKTRYFIEQIEHAKSVQEISAIVSRCAAPHGFDYAFAGTIPRLGEQKARQKSHVLIDQMPREWLNRYFVNGYLASDPTIRRILSGSNAFYWNEIVVDPNDAMAARVMHEAADFRLENGLTIPVQTLDGDVAALSLSGQKVDLDSRVRGMMTLVATYGIAKCFELDGQSSIKEVKLSPRQTDVLRWIAEGKTNADIAQILNISENSVIKYVKEAFLRLGATTRASAVATAIRAGIIA